MVAPDSPPPGTLDDALAIARPLVTWLLRSGVGHAQLVAALKPVFMAQAEAELARLGSKPTDSALSLLSGLHRKDVRQLRGDAAAGGADVPAAALAAGRPSAASQVVTRWLSLDWPRTLPFAGPEPSFEALARLVSTDVHHRAVADDLVRLGLAAESDGRVRLLRDAFVPQAGQREARQLLAGSVADHLAAGVHNLTGDGPRRFLEQSVFADGLSEASVKELHALANTLWADLLRIVVAVAVPLCEQDAHLHGTQRFRLGLFSYSEADAARKEDET